MTALSAFGLFAVSAMLVFYAFEQRSHWCILGFAISCALGSTYGFLQGAWPFGLVEGVWSMVALRKWWQVKPSTIPPADSIAFKVLNEEAPQLRASFDRALAIEIKRVCEAVDLAIQQEKRADALLTGMPQEQKLQQAHCLALIRKNLNDILGSLEILRAGYFDLSQGILRGVIEGFCTAILINKDTEIFQQYLKMRYSVNTSVDRVAKRQDLGLNPGAGATIKTVYEKLHNLTHPTILSVATQFPLKEAGFPIGGTLDQEKIEYYRDHLQRLQAMALSIAGFLQQRCGKDAPAPVKPALPQ